MTPMKRVAVRWLCMASWLGLPALAWRRQPWFWGTRIVYPEKAKDVSIRVRNPGSYPILAQSWLDDGRPDLSPEVMVVPFIVSPALTRVEPDGSALLRVPRQTAIAHGQGVAVLPERNGNSAAQQRGECADLAVSHPGQVVLRPTGLSGDAGDAPDSLKWTLVPGAGAVEVHNPTPYHVSFLSVELETAGRREILTGQARTPWWRHFPSCVFLFRPVEIRAGPKSDPLLGHQ